MAKKTLLLLRHAKSSWDDPSIDDFDRPLNARGRKAATRIGRLLLEESILIDLVLCSTSVRTRETAKRVFAEEKKPPTITYVDDLYHAPPEQIVQVLSQIVEPNPCVMVIGHNPGFAEFLEKVTGVCDSFPTSALAWLELKLDSWNLFDEQTSATLKHLWKPRELEAD